MRQRCAAPPKLHPILTHETFADSIYSNRLRISLRPDGMDLRQRLSERRDRDQQCFIRQARDRPEAGARAKLSVASGKLLARVTSASIHVADSQDLRHAV